MSEHNTAIDNIIRVLDEYARWFSNVITSAFYSDVTYKKTSAHIDAFNGWSGSQTPSKALDAISKAEQKCVNQAENILNNKSSIPSQEDFQSFVNAYNHFVNLMRQSARNIALDSSQIDPVTGLRTEEPARHEFKRELDRVIRDGKSFSVALLYIHTEDEGKSDTFLKIIEAIKQSIRSFDDAYILDNKNILLLLKQADSTGGVRALKRLKSMLSGRDAIPESIQILSCIAEPGEGDSYETLVENMRMRLDNEPKDRERILEYVELSPAERYVQGRT